MRLFAVATLAAMLATQAFAETDREIEFAAEIAEAERLGRIIYNYDIAVWRATDLLTERAGRDLTGKIKGWIVEEAEEGERVLFYRGSNGQFTPAYSVEVRNGEAVSASYQAFSENDRLSPSQLAMIRARETGADAGASGCAKAYNTVVVPDEATGYFVYILAASTEPGAVVLGGHWRHDVDSTGEKIVGFRKYTNSCLTLKSPKRSDRVVTVGLLVSHLLTDHPTEIHVWASLLHDISFFVATRDKRLWKVSAGKITDEASLEKASVTGDAPEPPALPER